jgi:phosphatidylserine/phosphatidylglycerophosphate/cardiolipin synthase-like enzyme
LGIPHLQKCKYPPNRRFNIIRGEGSQHNSPYVDYSYLTRLFDPLPKIQTFSKKQNGLGFLANHSIPWYCILTSKYSFANIQEYREYAIKYKAARFTMSNEYRDITRFSEKSSKQRKYKFLFVAFLAILLILLSSPDRKSIAEVAADANSDFQVGFSPNGESLSLIMGEISEARESILVAAYSFTSKPISQALLAAFQRGVMVYVVADNKSNQGVYSAVTFLANQGVPVRLNAKYKIFHHKFMVIDQIDVQTGSFNYSAAAANSNAENVLIVKNAPKLAAIYSQEWKRLWDEGVSLESRY